MRLETAFLFLGDCRPRYEDNILTLIPKLFTAKKINKNNHFLQLLEKLQLRKMFATDHAMLAWSMLLDVLLMAICGMEPPIAACL